MLIDWTYKLGDHIDGRIYSDLEVDELEKIDEQAIHRPVDVLLLEADRQGKFAPLSKPHVELELRTSYQATPAQF